MACAVSSKPMRISCEKAGGKYANSHFSDSRNTFFKMYRFYFGLEFLCSAGRIWFITHISIHHR
jgi:hypothetical protein